MALPIQIKNKLDNLYDQIINLNSGSTVYDKISIAAKSFKIKITKTDYDDKLKIYIEIIER